jgi:phosphoribosylcarboxyaminoimidazole (NCAIR) mutase
MGARNAGHLAIAILALADEALRRALKARRQEMAADVLGRDAALPGRLRKLLDKE